MPNDLPAGIEEVAREAIRARGLILRHLTYSMKYLIIREGPVERRQIALRESKVRPGEVTCEVLAVEKKLNIDGKWP